MTEADWTTDPAAAERWLAKALGAAGLPHQLHPDPQGRPVVYSRIDGPSGATLNVSLGLVRRACRIIAHGLIPAPPTAQGLANAERSNRVPSLMRLYPSPSGDALDGAMGLPVPEPGARAEVSKALALLVYGADELRAGRAPALADAAAHPVEDYARALDWLRGMGRETEEAPGEVGMARTRVALRDGDDSWLELVTGPDALLLRVQGVRAELRDPERARGAAISLNRMAPAGCVVWNEEAGAAESIVPLLPMLSDIGPPTLDWAWETARMNLEVAAQIAAQ